MDVMVVSQGWSRRARYAMSFGARLAGLRHSDPGESLLLETRSVHGFGMTRPVTVVALDRRLTVIGVDTLRPNRILGSRQARYFLEIPLGATPPIIGSTVEIRLV